MFPLRSLLTLLFVFAVNLQVQGLKCYVCDKCSTVTSTELKDCNPEANNNTSSTSTSTSTSTTSTSTTIRSPANDTKYAFELLSDGYADSYAEDSYSCGWISYPENGTEVVNRGCIPTAILSTLLCNSVIDYANSSLYVCPTEACNSAEAFKIPFLSLILVIGTVIYV